MAVQIIKFKRPLLYLSLKSGGSLTVGQEYFFMGLFTYGSGYYGMACSRASEEKSIIPTSGNQTINVEWYTDGGLYSSVVDAGGGLITVTTTAHGRVNGDTVFLRGGVYDGSYVISNVTTNTFDVTIAYSADDNAEWFADAGLSYLAYRIAFKWDKYTMIDSSDGTPYQWLNLNDPANSGKSEFDVNDGHRKWTFRYFVPTDGKTGTNGDFTQEATTATYNANYLYDGTIVGTNYRGNAFCIPDIQFRDHDSYYRLPAGYSKTNGKLLVYFDDTSANNEDTLINALEASGYTDMYTLSCLNNNYIYNDFAQAIMIHGHIIAQNSASQNTEVRSINLTLIMNGRTEHLGWLGKFKYSRCNIIYQAGAYYFWVYQFHLSYEDTTCQVAGTLFVLDYTIETINFAPAGNMTFYLSCSGYRMIRNPEQGYGGFSWRYPNKPTAYQMSDMYIKNFYIANTFRASYPTYTMTMDDVEFDNVNSPTAYDIGLMHNYMTGLDCNFLFECKNVSVNRNNGKVKVKIHHDTYPNSLIIKYNFRYDIKIKLTDQNNVSIQGASVSLTGTETSTDITDVNGEATVTGLSYTLEYDVADSDGYGYFTKTSDFLKMDLLITKAGYESYASNDITFSEGQEWTVSLKSSKSTRMSTDGELFYNLDKENMKKTINILKV